MSAATPEDHADAKATLPKKTGGAITASAFANSAPPINAPAAPVASAAKTLPPLLISFVYSKADLELLPFILVTIF